MATQQDTREFVRPVNRFLRRLTIKNGFSPNTEAAYRNDLYQLVDFLKLLRTVNSWADVTHEKLSVYLLKLKDDGYSNATLNRKVASLRSFFGFLVQKRVITQNPAKEIEIPKRDRYTRHPLTRAQVTKLLREAARPDGTVGLRDRAILELLYATGMLISELVSLNLDQLHLVEGEGYVQCFGKDFKERTIQINDGVVQTLKAYLTKGRPAVVRNAGEPAVFIGIGNRRGKQSERLSRQRCWILVKKYARRARIQSLVSPSVLRHSSVMHMLRNGATLRQVQKRLGHTSITTTRAYALVQR